jgi:hypothetical protein
MGSTKLEPNASVLVCLCGECAHWEIVGSSLQGSTVQNMAPIPVKLWCKTCQKEFDAKIEIPPSDHLAWVAPKEVRTE